MDRRAPRLTVPRAPWVVPAALFAAACSPAARPLDESLPRAVAIALTSRGAPITAFFSVQPNQNGHVDVRIANGLELPGERAVFAIEPTNDGRTAWHLLERLGGARVALGRPATAALRPSHLEVGAAWFVSSETSKTWRCELGTGGCAQAVEPAPAPRLTRPGPGTGFQFDLHDDTLRFHQPHQSEDTPGDVVATRVGEILGVRWYRDAPTPRVREYLDRTFRGRSSLVAEFGAVMVEGTLDEWATAAPAVVDAPWQLAEREGWAGPDDASFSVAARWSDAQICLAGRLRDDVLTAEDTFTVALGRDRWSFPPLAPGNQAAFHAETFGWHYELCGPRPPTLSAGHDLAFAMIYDDHDDDGAKAQLSTAPVYRTLPAGSLTLSPPVPAR